MIRLLLVMTICLSLGCDRGKGVIGAKAPVVDADMIEANNKGVGLMGQFEFQKAIEIFEKLSEKWPAEEVRTNLAIAYLNRQQEGDS